ncbi:hypothetical protein Btru_063813 [Bulinus truncatus]|nr:hypothetical protein Btru_063813 [Bulinus truncatus]
MLPSDNSGTETPVKHQDDIMSRRFIRKILVGLILMCSALAIYAVYLSSRNDGISANWKALVNNMQINDEINEQRPVRPARPGKVKGDRYHGENFRKRPNNEIIANNKFDRAGNVNDYAENEKYHHEKVQYDGRNGDRYNEVDETDNRDVNQEDDQLVQNDAGVEEAEDVDRGDDRVIQELDNEDLHKREDDSRNDNNREDDNRYDNNKEDDNRNDNNREHDNRYDNNRDDANKEYNNEVETVTDEKQTLHPNIQQEIEKHVVRDEHGRVKSEKLFPFGINHLMKEEKKGQDGIDDNGGGEGQDGVDDNGGGGLDGPRAKANRGNVDRPVGEDLLLNKVQQNDQIIDLAKNSNAKEARRNDAGWEGNPNERGNRFNRQREKGQSAGNRLDGEVGGGLDGEVGGGNDMHNDVDKFNDDPGVNGVKQFNERFLNSGKKRPNNINNEENFEPTVGGLSGENKIQENQAREQNNVEKDFQRYGMLPGQKGKNKDVGERNNGQNDPYSNQITDLPAQDKQSAVGKLSPELLNSILQGKGLNKELLQQLLESLQGQENINQQQQLQTQGLNNPQQQLPDQQQILPTPAVTRQQQLLQQQEVIVQPIEKSTKLPEVEKILVEDIEKPLPVQLNCVNYPYPSGLGVLCIHKSGKDKEVSDKIETDGTYEKDIMDQFYQILNQDISLDFLDIGAGIGVYSIAAALLHRNVVAVEPLFRNYRMLHKSALENKVAKKITLVTQALDTESYLGQMYYSHEGGFSNVTIVKLNRQMKQDPANLVHVTTLDNLLQVVSFKHAVMKLDANGMEGNILESGENFFKEVSVPYILTHWSVSNKLMQYVRMLSALTKLGYKPRMTWNGALANSDFLKTDHTFLVWTKT